MMMNWNWDELINEIRVDEFKSILREFLLERFEVDVSVQNLNEFLGFDLCVFKNSYGDYLSKSELEVAELFFLLMRSVYLTATSRLEISSALKSEIATKFADIYSKLKYQLCVI